LVDVKNINKLIVHYICEIVIVLIFVGISVPVWNKLDKSNVSSIANTYANMDYLYLDINKYIGYNDFKDEVVVVNDTNTIRNYKLVLKLDKNIDINDTEIVLNDNSEKLEDLLYKDTGDYNYYLIATGDVVASKEVYNVTFKNSNLNYKDVTYEIIETKIA
jgi:hypothetical protein